MTFYVHASNIHTEHSERYGPFPGSPGITYELLRCFEDGTSPLDGEHIFQFREEREGAFFIHSDDGEPVSYGWRRLAIEPIKVDARGLGTYHQIEYGPIWTDLFMEPTDAEPLTSNRLDDVASPDEAREAREQLATRA